MAKKQPVSAPETILDEAARAVHGPRQETYGHPRDNFARTAEMWSAFLRQRMARLETPQEFEFTPEDVAMFMVLLKVARLANTPGHRDTLVDIAGYAATAELCGDQE